MYLEPIDDSLFDNINGTTFTMSIFGIAGNSTCLNFAHATYVADHLKKHLPNFTFYTIVKDGADWQCWLDRKNRENKWYRTTSPLIWKEVTRRGGKPHLIGGLSEFWEYCYDYHGILSTIPKSDLNKIIADNLSVKKKEPQPRINTVSIIGASEDITEFLIAELQSGLTQNKNDKLCIRLYDKNFDDDLELAEYLLNLIQQLESFVSGVSIVLSMKEAIKNCDLLIIVEDFSRKPNEEFEPWLRKCILLMRMLAEEIDENAQRNLRVVLSHDGPVCLNATILVQNCTRIRLANIVAVTADEGISLIAAASNHTEIAAENIGCPPVWGFRGINSFVDLEETIIRGYVNRPYHQRAITSRESSVLPKAKLKVELRTLSYKILDENVILIAAKEKKRKQLELIGKPAMLARVRAIGSLVKLWFTSTPDDDIISLGVCSNGSFGIPAGIVFSQPVTLNERHLWEPFSEFPITEKVKWQLSQMVTEVKEILKKFGLEQKID